MDNICSHRPAVWGAGQLGFGVRGLWLRSGDMESCGGGSKEGRKPTQATSKTSLLLEMAFNYSLVVQEVADVG